MKYLSPDQTFLRYETIRDRLPCAEFPTNAAKIPHLGEVSDDFDAFVFDSYGVLNVGSAAISGAAERIAALRCAQKTIFVLTNAASVPVSGNVARYQKLGFNFSKREVISSREALILGMKAHSTLSWAVMAPKGADLSDLPGSKRPFTKIGLDAVDGFILLSSFEWMKSDQEALYSALRTQPRPVLVGNPDVVAPTDSGQMVQPGYFAHDLADRLGIVPVFFGKPFGNAFEIAKQRLPAEIPLDRVLMVGDTLHTDILGGAAAGFKTALALANGVHQGLDIEACIAVSGIVPDYILPAI